MSALKISSHWEEKKEASSCHVHKPSVRAFLRLSRENEIRADCVIGDSFQPLKKGKKTKTSKLKNADEWAVTYSTYKTGQVWAMPFAESVAPVHE